MKYASYYLSAIAISVPLLFTMCGPMYAQRGTSATSSKAVTFYTLSTENGENTPPPATWKTRDIEVLPDAVPKCNFGELDLADAALACHANTPFIVTVKDAISEIAVFKYDLTANTNITQLMSWFEIPLQRQISGDKLDIFVCLDSNLNGQCIDEPIVDINQMTGAMLAAKNAGQNLPELFCGQLKNGAVLYHSQHNLADIAGTTVSTPVTGAVAGMVQQQLRNLNGETPAPPAPVGTKIQFPIKLAKFEQAQCPPPAVRTDGCFVKGTKINVTKEASVAIEKLHAGQSVILADGRYAKIQRVVAGPEHKPVVEFATAKGTSITVTSEHPLLTQAGMKLAKDIAIGQQLKTADGKFVEITSIKTKKYKDNVYNMELEGTPAEADHSVIANGLVSGELYLQNLMSGKGRTDNPNILTGR